MTGIIDAIHPVPMRYLPRRGRVEALSFARGTTPVRLREADRSEMNQVAVLPLTKRHGILPVHVMDGQAWRPVLTQPVSKVAEIKHHTLGQRELVEWLEGRAVYHPKGPYANVPRHFAGTPLMARLYGTLGEVRYDEGHSPARVRDMVEDGSERASAGVSRFFEDGLAICDGTVYVRCRGPLAVTPDRGASYQLLPMPGAFEQYHVHRDPMACGLDGVQAHSDSERLDVEDLEAVPERGPVKLSWDPETAAAIPTDDSEIRLFLNHEPRRILYASARPEEVECLSRGMAPGDYANLRSMAAWGAVGGVPAEAATEAFAVFKSAYRARRDVPRHEMFGSRQADFIDGYLSGRLALTVPDLADDDAIALATMASNL